MVFCRFHNRFCAGGSDEGAIGEDGVGGENAFCSARDEGEDVGLWDHDDADPSLDQRLLEAVDVRCFDAVVVAGDDGVRFGVGIGVALSVDDGELPLCGCFEQEALNCETCSVGEDGFGRMDVVEGVIGDLVVGLVEFVNDFGDAVEYLSPEVYVCLGLLGSRCS